MDELNLVDKVKSGFTPDVVARIGSFVGESPGKTQQVISEAVPSIFTGLAEKASSDTGAKVLYEMVKESTAAKAGMAEVVSEEGQGMMSSLFGDRTSAVTDRVAKQAGVSPGAASKIMGFVGPAIMGLLGREITSRGIGVAGLATMLTGRRPALATSARPAATATRSWLPLILLGGLALLAAWLLMGRGRQRTVEPRAQAPVPAAPAKPPAVAPAAPSAPQLMAPPTAMGASGEALTAYLNDSTAELPKRFAFEGLDFALGSATLAAPPLSADGIAAALKAHPTARVRLDGYVDTLAGNAEQAQALSLARAEAARTTLVNKGIDESRISVAGLASSNPIASNDTDQGRAQNRRVEMVVLSR